MNEPLWIKRIRTAKENVEDYVASLNYSIAKYGNNEDKSNKLEEARKKLAELEHIYKESIIKYKEWQIRKELE